MLAALRKYLERPGTWLQLMGLGLLLRLVLLALLAPEPLVSDAKYYHEAAVALAQHGTIDTYWPPGLPLYEAVVVFLFGKGEFWVRLAMLPWFWWLGRSLYQCLFRLHSRLAANAGLLLLILYPDLIHQSVEPLSYLPAAALLFAVFARMLRYLEDRRSRSLWRMGLLLGVLVLFRPSAALFLVALPPLILVRRRKLVPGLVLVLGAAMVVGPWLWLVNRELGGPVFMNTANARNLYLGNNDWTPLYKTWYYGSHWTGDPDLPAGFRAELARLDSLPQAARSRAYLYAARAEASDHPWDTAVRTAARFRTLLASDTLAGARLRWAHHPLAGAGYAVLALAALYWVALGLAFAGSYFTRARREITGGTFQVIMGFALVYALPYWISFSHPSYHLPVVPLMIVPAAVWLAMRLHHGAWPKLLPGRAWRAALAVLAFLAIEVEWLWRMWME